MVLNHFHPYPALKSSASSVCFHGYVQYIFRIEICAVNWACLLALEQKTNSVAFSPQANYTD
jgi:hypothetical protein